MGTNLIRAMLLASAGVAVVAAGAPTAAYAQEATYQLDIPSQSMGDALRALGKATKQNIVFSGSVVKGKRSAAVRGRMSASEALDRMLAGSGLKMGRGSGGGFTVLQAGNAQGDGQAANDGGLSQGLTGAIVDQKTGAALKGAFVTLIDSGKSTSTDDLGRYRFAGLEGVHRVSISYLGFPATEREVTFVKGRPSASIALSNVAADNEIVVIAGQVSARAQALNQERTAENSSTVISSDLLGDFGGQTISETLRRAPGVTFDRDNFTGDGTNIAIRGLSPDFNSVQLNGIELPVGDGTRRAADLGNIQTESIESVTINKTLLPNHDSAGSGGLVTIETKSPLDRKRRFAAVSIEGGTRANGFGDEFSTSGTVSARFGGADNFGVSASVQYRSRTVRRVNTSNVYTYGEFLPLQVDGTPTVFFPDMVDPRRPFPFEDGAGGVFPISANVASDETRAKNLSVTLSAAWEPTPNTSWRVDYQAARSDQERFARSYTLTAPSVYALRPVVALNGEERLALSWSGAINSSTSYEYNPKDELDTDVLTFRGRSTFGRLETKYSVGYTVGSNNSDEYALSLNGRAASVGDPSFISPGAVDPGEGVILSLFPRQTGKGLVLPSLTEAGAAYFASPDFYNFSGGRTARLEGKNERLAGDLSLKYDFPAGPLKYLEIGGQYERSTFTSRPTKQLLYLQFTPDSSENLGLSFDDDILSPIGQAGRFPVLSRSDLKKYAVSGLPASAIPFTFPDSFDPGVVTVLDLTASAETLKGFTRETEFSGYAQARFDIGKLEIIGGARFSNVKIQAVSFNAPTILNEDGSTDDEFTLANSQLLNDSVTQFEVLPRVLMNYRVSENVIIRGGYFLSIARPQIQLLNQTPSYFLDLRPVNGPFLDKPRLSITKGNPDLKPAATHSFDIGIERYSGRVGVMKLNFFYKRIDNLLENNTVQNTDVLDGIVLPDDPRFTDVVSNPQNYDLQLRYPVNNRKSANIWGIEASAERQLSFLPGGWGGLGVFGNYTFSKSSKTLPYFWSFSPVRDETGTVINYEGAIVDFDGVDFANSARHSGTVGISYSKFGIDARASYTFQSKRTAGFFANGLGAVEDAYGTLDARLEYRIPATLIANARVFVEGYDLLRGPGDPGFTTSDRVSGSRTGASYYGGRQVRAGVSAVF